MVIEIKTEIIIDDISFKMIDIDNVVHGRYYISEFAELYDLKYKRYIIGHVNKGYLRVTLATKNNKQKSYYMHILVICTYLSDYRKTLTVNHEDGCKLNNRLDNLKWMTYRDNMKHAINTGLVKDRSMLTEPVVHEICVMIQSGMFIKDISKKLNINKQTIYGIRTGLNWKDISSGYNFKKRDKYIKLNSEIVTNICEDVALGLSIKAISVKYDIKYATVGSIKQKVTWKHISDKFF